jgi:AcrR family transcriptional regulator
MKANEKAIIAAIRLFRQNGTVSVTTNHIAEAAGISPGNLYYHFRNKEEIIREVFEYIIRFMDHVWSPIEGAPDQAISRVLLRLLTLYRSYGFFYRDLPELLRRDPILKTRYLELRNRRFTEMSNVIIQARIVGWLSIDDLEIERLLHRLWFVSECWPVYADLQGGAWWEGLTVAADLLRPFFTDKGQGIFEKAIIPVTQRLMKE